MAVNHSVDVVAMLREQVVAASPDLARQMLASLAQALMSADADAICGAGFGEVSPDRMKAPTAEVSGPPGADGSSRLALRGFASPAADTSWAVG